MKKRYTKKQITEAIAYWKKRLNEDASSYHYAYTIDPYLYITELNHCFAEPIRKVGTSHGSQVEREDPETLEKKLKRYNTCVYEDWKAFCQIILDDNDAKKLFACEKELFNLLKSKYGKKELFKDNDDDVRKAIDEFKIHHPTAEVVFYND